ncbi:unnamed protein product [Danaus chrysippus]|uniref:(African queen) hypothetical protein n=1 Tax=Danaus chrysippus TaxID=151541 RepID=A0A8J2R3P0_9NEOP|nr:unnamed protein product [Danaus chrysippus]
MMGGGWWVVGGGDSGYFTLIKETNFRGTEISYFCKHVGRKEGRRDHEDSVQPSHSSHEQASTQQLIN